MTKSTGPQAHSYFRISTSKHAKRDSLRRQFLLSEAWGEKNGLVLDAGLRIVDGASAISEENGSFGALGALLRAAENGEVPRGSYLLVESLNQLSTIDMVVGLLRNGVTIVSLCDQTEYSEKSLNDLGGLMTSITGMFRAREESAAKLLRVSALWEEKRASLGQMKRMSCAPSWLRLSIDRKTFVVIEARAKIVNEIFQNTLRGLGTITISKALNSSGCETWGAGGRKALKWDPSTLAKILGNEAVFGRYRSRRWVEGKADEVIDNYYPAIVSEDLFNRVRASRPGKPCMPGRGVGSDTHPFQTITLLAL